MHRSQRTGAVTWRTRRCSISRPWLTADPSRFDSRIRAGSLTVTPAGDRGEGPLGRGHERGVERARHLQRDDPGPGGRLGGELAQAVQRSGGDDLTGAVAVGREQPVCLDRGDDLGRVAAEDGAHAGRFEGAGGGHLPAAYPGEGDRGLGGQHPGEGGGTELADAVAGDQADVVHGQVLGGQQGGGDEQWLGARGVPDLVGVGLGAEVDEIDAGEGGPPPQARFGAGQVEPGREEAGLLGALAGREYGEHVLDSP